MKKGLDSRKFLNDKSADGDVTMAIPVDALARLITGPSSSAGRIRGFQGGGVNGGGDGNVEPSPIPGTQTGGPQVFTFPGAKGGAWGDFSGTAEYGPVNYGMSYSGFGFNPPSMLPGSQQGPTMDPTFFDAQGYPMAVPVFNNPTDPVGLMHLGQMLKPMQKGGVATAENKQPPWMPVRSNGSRGIQAAARDNAYQDGGTVPAWSEPTPLPMNRNRGPEVRTYPASQPRFTPQQMEMLRQHFLSAIGLMGVGQQNQYATPIYNAQMLTNPPEKLSGYAHELSGEYQQGGVVYPGVGVDESGLPTLGATQAPPQTASNVAGEPTKMPQQKQQQQQQAPQKYEFGPDFFYTPQGFQKLVEMQNASLQKGMKEGGTVEMPKEEFKEEHQHLLGVLQKKDPDALDREGRSQAKEMQEEGVSIPKEFMQYLARGGLVNKFTPDHHLMFALGMKYALSPSQAAKRMDKRSTPNPMPP